MKKKKIYNSMRWLFLLIQSVLSVLLIYNIVRLDMLPANYLIGICIGIAACWFIVCIIYMIKKIRKAGFILNILIILIFGIGVIYLSRTHTVLENGTIDVTEDTYRLDNIVVAVAKDDVAQTMDDTLLYNFGIMKTADRNNTDQIIEEIEGKAGLTLTITEFEDYKTLFRNLSTGKVQAVIYNTAYDGMIEDIVKNFKDNIRIINSHEIKTAINLTSMDMNVTQKPFTIFISGRDVYGAIETTSRSDVNMLVTVNPQTKKIILSTTPRDSWVPLPEISNGMSDKLTHAGIYGIDCSMNTLSQIYGIKVDYYVVVNFTTLKKIVDALGGVNVYSEYEFTTHHKNGGHEIKQGMNYMNGKVALAFSRERYNVPNGDLQRGKNQQAVLTALLKKAMSPSILTGYLGIMEGLEGNFETNMTTKQIASLVKMQLNDGASWEIESQSATGTFGQEVCFSSGRGRYSIVYLDRQSVYDARLKMLEVGAVALLPDHPLYTSFEDMEGSSGETESYAYNDEETNAYDNEEINPYSNYNNEEESESYPLFENETDARLITDIESDGPYEGHAENERKGLLLR